MDGVDISWRVGGATKTHRVFPICAVTVSVGHPSESADAIPFFELGDAFADSLDCACNVVTLDGRVAFNKDGHLPVLGVGRDGDICAGARWRKKQRDHGKGSRRCKGRRVKYVESQFTLVHGAHSDLAVRPATKKDALLIRTSPASGSGMGRSTRSRAPSEMLTAFILFVLARYEVESREKEGSALGERRRRVALRPTRHDDTSPKVRKLFRVLNSAMSRSSVPYSCCAYRSAPGT